MNRVLAGVLVLLALIVGTVVAVLGLSDRPPSPEVAAAPDSARELERLSRELAALSERLALLERSSELARAPERAPTSAPAAAAPVDVPAGLEEHDARWYLDQYVASFRDDEKGSELYRLHVDARAAELVDPIRELARDSGRPLALRVSLVAMLGRSRFLGDPAVGNTLLDVLRENGPDRLGLAAIDALASAGGPGVLPSLEAAVFTVTSGKVRTRTIQLAINIAREGANGVVLRLLARAPDDAIACAILAFLDAVDQESALLVFRNASGRNQPVRLCAAQKIGEFAEPPFVDFVAEWLSFEIDPPVIAALRGALQRQKTVPQWDARQAIGPPDAEPSRDDPKAWATAEAEMGMQWLELDYASPMTANAVRIFEVNVPGAVAEIAARGPSGDWASLWSGTARSRTGGPLEIEFPTTSFAVRTLRVYVDTNRAPDWNEIDAVELLGPSGRQWASGARASSNYGHSNGRAAREARVTRRLTATARPGPRDRSVRRGGGRRGSAGRRAPRARLRSAGTPPAARARARSGSRARRRTP